MPGPPRHARERMLRRATPEQIRAWNAELARLQAEQDSLRERAAELIAGDAADPRLPKGEW